MSMAGSGALRPRESDAWVEQVRAASDVVEVIGQTVALKKQGRNWVGLCPFHGEKTPSFSVNAERQFFHCFGCKVGGDVFRFVMDTEHIGFLEAVERLSRRAGIPVPERRPGEARERGRKQQQLDALELAATAYEQWLADPATGARVRATLEARGVSRETQRRFRLGASPEGWEHLVRRLGGKVPDDVLVEAGLAARRERGGLYDRFRNRLMFPLIAPDGAVVGFGARALADTDQPKYLNSPESVVYQKSRYVYGLAEARRAAGDLGELVVVEGQFDVLMLHQAGVTNAVATSGTALTPEHARQFQRVAPRVVLTFDGDAAGQSAMLRSLGVLIGAGLEVAVVDLPAGQDPDDLVRKGGRAAWELARRQSADPVAFVQRHVLRAAGGGDARQRALEATVELVATAPDPLAREGLVRRADEVFGVELHGFREALKRALTLRARGEGTGRPIAALVERQRTVESYAERKLLATLLQHPHGLDRARAQVSPADFRDPHAAALAEWLWAGGTGEPPAALAAFVRELLTAEPEPNGEDGLEMAARVVASRRIRRQLHEHTERLRHAGGVEEEQALQREILDLRKQLTELGV